MNPLGNFYSTQITSGFVKTLLSEIVNRSGFKSTFLNYADRENKFLGGRFKCSYQPSLSLELSEIEDVGPSLSFENKSLKYLRTVRIKQGTEGIKDPDVVAIFPENFENHIVRDDDVIFYFVDKFANRHMCHTREIIKRYVVSSQFDAIKFISEDSLGSIVSNWVVLHEKNHRQGPLPIPDSLKEKSNRMTAAVEELRVDLLSMKECLNKSKNRKDEYRKTFEFILSERLLGYPFFRDVDLNFDAISSCILYSHLLEQHLLKFSDLEIKLDENLLPGIESLLRKIEIYEIESESIVDFDDRKKYMKKFIETNFSFGPGNIHFKALKDLYV